jgi:hypothetical protein
MPIFIIVLKEGSLAGDILGLQFRFDGERRITYLIGSKNNWKPKIQRCWGMGNRPNLAFGARVGLGIQRD